MPEPVVGRITFEMPRHSGAYEAMRHEYGMLTAIREENEALKERLKVHKLTVEVEDPNAGGGLAILTQEQAQRHARRAYACGRLWAALLQHEGEKLDAKAVSEVFATLWMADEPLSPERLMATLGLEEPHA